MKKRKKDKKKSLEEFYASPDFEKTAKLETLAYLCHGIANQAREEIDTIMNQYNGMIVFDVAYFSNNLTKAFDRYEYAVRQMIGKESWNQFSLDYEKARKALYVFAGLEPRESDDPSCSAENNDQIEMAHVADNDKC